MNYAAGFAQGERQSFKDRSNGVRTAYPAGMNVAQAKGYRDGYSARNPQWAMRPTQSGAGWWVKREACCD